MKLYTTTLGALVLSTAVSAQYAFELADKDENAIYTDIMVAWRDWAAAGNGVLASAKDDYPDAYAQLKDIYGTTSLPGLFNEGLARNAAKRLAGVSETTVWDKGQASAQGEFSFSTTELSASSGPQATPTGTGGASKTPEPTSGGGHGSATSGGGHGSATSGGGGGSGGATSDDATTGGQATDSGDQTDQTGGSGTHATSVTGSKTTGATSSPTSKPDSGAAGMAAGQLIAAVVAAAVVAIAI